MKKVAVIMGSDSDFPAVKPAILKLKSFGIPVEAHVMSAHRTPEQAAAFAGKAQADGFDHCRCRESSPPCRGSGGTYYPSRYRHTH